MLFGALLQALRTQGRHVEAAMYEKAVTDKFYGVLTVEEIRALDVDEIVAVLSIVKELVAVYNPKQSALQNYVAYMRANGFQVSVAEKYQKCLQ